MDVSKKTLKELEDIRLRKLRLGDVPDLYIERKGKTVELKNITGKKVKLL